MTQSPWRVKGDAQHKTKIGTQPGQVVSVDQLESPTLGFATQLRGILTTQRYKYASIFVDQYSDLSFVFLQKRLTCEETVLAKKTFERYAILKGVWIQHYHADSSHFSYKGFVNHCQHENQTLTYCGVNATFKMVWQTRRSGTSKRRHKLDCSMPCTSGQG